MSLARATPYLEVDLPRLEANIERAAAWARESGVALRPHAKTHKSTEVVRRQVAAGAVGLGVATVGEAEALVTACDDLFVAYPVVVDDDRAVRLRALAERARVAIGVDSVDGASAAGSRLAGSGVEVLVEVDCGLGRTGCPPDEAGEVARAAGPLVVRGAFTFPGHSYGPGAGEAAAADEARALTAAGAALRSAGVTDPVLSGGSTPSLASSDTTVADELRPGVYVYGDAQQVELGTCAPDAVALTAVASVVHARPGTVVLDAGSKVLGPDRPSWASGHGHVRDVPGGVVRGLWEHHAVVTWPPEQPLPAVGSRLRLVPNHACTAANLVPEVVVVADGEPVDVWAVDARAANS